MQPAEDSRRRRPRSNIRSQDPLHRRHKTQPTSASVLPRAGGGACHSCRDLLRLQPGLVFLHRHREGLPVHGKHQRNLGEAVRQSQDR